MLIKLSKVPLQGEWIDLQYKKLLVLGLHAKKDHKYLNFYEY